MYKKGWLLTVVVSYPAGGESHLEKVLGRKQRISFLIGTFNFGFLKFLSITMFI